MISLFFLKNGIWGSVFDLEAGKNTTENKQDQKDHSLITIM